MISRPWIRRILRMHSPSMSLVGRCRCRRCRRTYRGEVAR